MRRAIDLVRLAGLLVLGVALAIAIGRRRSRHEIAPDLWRD